MCLRHFGIFDGYFRQVWRDAKQRAGYFAAAARTQAAWPDPGPWPWLGEAIALLEAAHPTVRAELLRAAGAEEGAALSLQKSGMALGVDNENLTDSGLWRQRIFMRNGLPLFEDGETGAAGFEAAFPETVAAVRKVLGVGGGAGEGLPKGSVEFSILDAGTHIKPHCVSPQRTRCMHCACALLPKTSILCRQGPSNHKWRLHLGVVVPDGGVSSIRVGDAAAAQARRPWEEGKVLLFDDSYEHEVFHEGGEEASPRVVLIVDLWHPEVSDAAAREQVRRDFGWHAARDSLRRVK